MDRRLILSLESESVSIFGKKMPGQGNEGDGLRQSPDSPSHEKYSNPANTLRSPSASPTMEPPQVQRAVPPTVTHTPGHSPQQTQAPTMPNNATIAPGHRTMPQTQNQRESEHHKSPYSIDDVIRLMRELPDSKKEMVVVIVQKTLMSARIDVASIIDDASRKVEKLTRANDKVVAEIRELEEAIIQRKAEVDRLSRELEETTSVKQIFEVTYGRHVKGEADNEKNPTAPMPSMKLF